MGFLINCDNKGCCKSQEALLDTKTDEVYCSECNKTITNVTPFAKKQLKFMGQVKKASKGQEALAVKCQVCGKNGAPKLNGNKILCLNCNSEITNISKPFARLIKDKLKNQ